MNTKIFCLALCALLFTPCSALDAQQPKKVTRIGYLSSSDPITESARSEGIRQALHDLGYVEGQNIAFEYRYAEGKLDRFPEIVAELVRFKVDIIVVAGGNTLIRAAKNATKTISIVMAGAAPDPVEAGFVDSLARPGGNVTGLALLFNELAGKRLELLKEAVPKLARVAVLHDPALSPNILELKEVQAAASALGLTIRYKQLYLVENFLPLHMTRGRVLIRAVVHRSKA